MRNEFLVTTVLILLVLPFVWMLFRESLALPKQWMQDLKNSAELEEQGREVKFLRRLLAIRRDWMNDPVRLRHELAKLFQAYREVPRCVTHQMSLSDMLTVLMKATGAGWVDPHKQELVERQLTEATRSR